jgi:hypothetical protein
MSSAITSRGCCRAIIICTLYRCLESVQLDYEDGKVIQCPFPVNTVMSWILQAQLDCETDENFQLELGGTMYDKNDSSTYWNSSQQFYTW